MKLSLSLTHSLYLVTDWRMVLFISANQSDGKGNRKGSSNGLGTPTSL